jgi:hypothetical protein
MQLLMHDGLRERLERVAGLGELEPVSPHGADQSAQVPVSAGEMIDYEFAHF